MKYGTVETKLMYIYKPDRRTDSQTAALSAFFAKCVKN